MAVDVTAEDFAQARIWATEDYNYTNTDTLKTDPQKWTRYQDLTDSLLPPGGRDDGAARAHAQWGVLIIVPRLFWPSLRSGR